jgi:hypothetical protein
MADRLSVGELRERIVYATELGGAFGENLHESKDVLVQVGDEFWQLSFVKVAFRGGRFVLVLEAGEADR